MLVCTLGLCRYALLLSSGSSVNVKVTQAPLPVILPPCPEQTNPCKHTTGCDQQQVHLHACKNAAHAEPTHAHLQTCTTQVLPHSLCAAALFSCCSHATAAAAASPVPDTQLRRQRFETHRMRAGKRPQCPAAPAQSCRCCKQTLPSCAVSQTPDAQPGGNRLLCPAARRP